MKINEDLIIPSFGKTLLESINDSIEIEETGSNNNGCWIKLKNGIMIQYGKQSMGNQTFSTDWWNFMKRSGSESMSCTFPIKFVGIPYCVISPNCNAAIPFYPASQATEQISQRFGMASPPGATGTREVTCSFIAIGRWK